MAALEDTLEGTRKEVIHTIYSNINNTTYNEDGEEHGMRVVRRDGKHILKTNSFIISNFAEHIAAQVSHPYKGYMNNKYLYSDHKCLDHVENRIRLRSHNLLRYGDLFQTNNGKSMEFSQITQSSPAKDIYNSKHASQLNAHFEYFNSRHGNVLALQECDYKMFYDLRYSLIHELGSHYICLFIPRSIRITQDKNTIIPFIPGSPNPLCNTFGNALIIKNTNRLQYITNLNDMDLYSYRKKLTEYVYETRSVYILFPSLKVGYISCHESHEYFSIKDTISDIFRIHPDIKTLYLLGDFNRDDNTVMSLLYPYTNTHLHSEPNWKGIVYDHIIKVEPPTTTHKSESDKGISEDRGADSNNWRKPHNSTLKKSDKGVSEGRGADSNNWRKPHNSTLKKSDKGVSEGRADSNNWRKPHNSTLKKSDRGVSGKGGKGKGVSEDRGADSNNWRKPHNSTLKKSDRGVSGKGGKGKGVSGKGGKGKGVSGKGGKGKGVSGKGGKGKGVSGKGGKGKGGSWSTNTRKR